MNVPFMEKDIELFIGKADYFDWNITVMFVQSRISQFCFPFFHIESGTLHISIFTRRNWEDRATAINRQKKKKKNNWPRTPGRPMNPDAASGYQSPRGEEERRSTVSLADQTKFFAGSIAYLPWRKGGWVSGWVAGRAFTDVDALPGAFHVR